jgi:2-keto-3-deoxy-L-rhamnonate aldolase RhmA
MVDRLTQLLKENACLYGLICRDPTPIDIELMAQLGYHLVWLDLEHCLLAPSEAVRLGRTITHLGMVPLVRIPELARTHVQLFLDEGIQILVVPDIRDVEQVRHLVTLGKYPPLGQRGVSSTSAGTDYTLGADPQQTLAEINKATRLMALIESDQGYQTLDAMLAVEGLDMVGVGTRDWTTSLGLSDAQAQAQLEPKIARIITRATKADKMVILNISSPEQARRYQDLGARIFLLGVDITIKRAALAEKIDRFL